MTLIVGLLAAVLALQAADLATVGAVGAELESAFGLSHIELAILASVASLLGAVATLPFGVLADRLPRVRLLALVVALWGVVSGVAGLADSFAVLLGSRLFLGVTVAAAGPCSPPGRRPVPEHRAGADLRLHPRRGAARERLRLPRQRQPRRLPLLALGILGAGAARPGCWPG